jgi:hypothetical protein
MAHQSALSDEDVQRAVRYVRSVLPHVSDCDGLSIMVERLPEQEVQGVFCARAREVNLNLLEWVDQVRGRPVVLPA